MSNTESKSSDRHLVIRRVSTGEEIPFAAIMGKTTAVEILEMLRQKFPDCGWGIVQHRLMVAGRPLTWKTPLKDEMFPGTNLVHWVVDDMSSQSERRAGTIQVLCRVVRVSSPSLLDPHVILTLNPSDTVASIYDKIIAYLSNPAANVDVGEWLRYNSFLTDNDNHIMDMDQPVSKYEVKDGYIIACFFGTDAGLKGVRDRVKEYAKEHTKGKSSSGGLPDLADLDLSELLRILR